MLLRLVLCSSLILALLLSAACIAEHPETTISKPETAEVYIDPDPEVQMLRDAFPDNSYYSENILHSANILRENGIGSFVTLERVPDEEISDEDKRLSVAFMLDITDETGECFRVGFSRSGIAIFIGNINHEIIWLNPPPIQ